MTDFDPLKAQREIVTGLAEVHGLVQHRCRTAELRLSEAEHEFNAMAKLMRFTEGMLDEARKELKRLDDAAKAKEKEGKA